MVNFAMENSESRPIFTLSVAAEIIGVHPRTLMIYEKEGLLTPSRTRTNRRRFTREDIHKLQFIRHLTNAKGINLAGVKAINEIIRIGSKFGVDITKESFPDFSPTEI